MRTLKYIAISCSLVLAASNLFAQKAYLADPENFDPEGEVKLMVDLTKCDNQNLVGNAGPLYMWTWNPAELPATDANANGSWTASNPALEMTNEGGDIWSFTMVPTEFYQVDKGTVYANDFSLLVKALDGSDAGAGEMKTEDLSISVDPPVTPAQVISGFPSVAFADDVFTILYDNTAEEKETMQNLGDDENIYAMLEFTLSDSSVVKPYSIFTIEDNPELKMTAQGEGRYTLSMMPEAFFADQVPVGMTIISLEVKGVVRDRYLPANQSNATLVFQFGCITE